MTKVATGTPTISEAQYGDALLCAHLTLKLSPELIVEARAREIAFKIIEEVRSVESRRPTWAWVEPLIPSASRIVIPSSCLTLDSASPAVDNTSDFLRTNFLALQWAAEHISKDGKFSVNMIRERNWSDDPLGSRRVRLEVSLEKGAS